MTAQARCLGDAEAERHGGRVARVAPGVDEHEPGDGLGVEHGELPGEAAAVGVAHQHAAGDLPLREQGADQVEGRLESRVAVGEGTGEAEAGEVEGDDAVFPLEGGDPALPGVQAGGGAVQQHERSRVVPRPDVAQVHAQPVDLDELGRGRSPAGGQLLDRAVRLPRVRNEPADREQQQDPESLLHDANLLSPSPPRGERVGERGVAQCYPLRMRPFPPALAKLLVPFPGEVVTLKLKKPAALAKLDEATEVARGVALGAHHRYDAKGNNLRSPAGPALIDLWVQSAGVTFATGAWIKVCNTPTKRKHSSLTVFEAQGGRPALAAAARAPGRRVGCLGGEGDREESLGRGEGLDEVARRSPRSARLRVLRSGVGD